MPFASFTRVREVSSEDNIHSAENLIKGHPGKKWKTKNPGEKSAYVILEMSDSCQITGIDIGNEHSAFVEVLVGKSSCAPEEFTEILITCSFMTPTESKNSSNTNRVRCFNREALVPTAAEHKWSLVKILCTQPFNKHVSYGLSFIKIHVNDNLKTSSTTQNALVPHQVLKNKLEPCGKLKFREDSPESEVENSSSLFSRWRESKNSVEDQTTAASIRMASINPSALQGRRCNIDEKPISLTSKTHDKYLDRNRENLLFGEETGDMFDKNVVRLERLYEHIEVDKKRRCLEKEKEATKKPRRSLDCSPKSIIQLAFAPATSKSTESSFGNVKKQRSSSKENSVKKVQPFENVRPFNQLLKDVVLVISGIQNPDRGDLRSKALALGAKYKADWDATCTHLICAFKNTPKYNQVKGTGKIVTRRWIEKCYTLKKYLPWRRYALDSKELSQPESDEEVFSTNQISRNEEADLVGSGTSSRRKSEDNSNDTLALYDIGEKANVNNSVARIFSESDTDDEIQKVEKNLANEEVKADQTGTTTKTVNIYDASTDEEDYLNEKVLKEMNSD